jgi:predicted esterase
MDPHAGQPVLVSGQPLGSSRAAIIMIHGRGADPRSILELAAALPHPDVAYLAPAASGQTWYPLSFMAPIAQNEPGITSGLAAIDRVVADVVSQGVPKERIILLGFSQGACLTSTYAVRHATRFGGVIAFSGGLIGAPGTEWNYPGTFDGTPVFLGCSDIDGHVPMSRVHESTDVFRRMGATVTERIYPGMGHLVNEDEIAFARDLLAQVTSAGTTTA